MRHANAANMRRQSGSSPDTFRKNGLYMHEGMSGIFATFPVCIRMEGIEYELGGVARKQAHRGIEAGQFLGAARP